MADNTTEIKRIIDIEFKGAKTIGDIKKDITQLKKELDQCANGSKEAAAKSLELARAQNTLTAAMKGCVDETGKLDNSYNGLVSQMNRLKIAQKQIDLSTKDGQKEFNKLGKEIKSINDKLVKLDATNGVFGRNVGNYTSALSAMGGQFGTIAKGINTVKIALQALKASAGWVGLVVGIITGIIAAIKSSEEAVDRLKIAVSPFVGLFNQLITLAQELGNVVSKSLTWLLNGVDNLTKSFLELIGAEETLKKMRESNDIAKKEKLLEEQRLAILNQQNERLSEMKKLQDQYAKWRKDDNIAAYIAYQIEEKRKEEAIDMYNLRKAEYELIVEKNKQTKSGRKETEEELEAKQKMIEAEAQLYTSGEEWVRVMRTGSIEAKKSMLILETAASQRRIENLEENKAHKQRLKEQAELRLSLAKTAEERQK